MFDQRKQFKFITKCDGIITNCDSLVYYKVQWTVITNCDSLFITKCDTVHYKLRHWGFTSLRTADAFPVVASLPPKNSVCETERHNDFRDVNLLFWCWPIRSKDRIRLEWLLATSRAEASRISARVTNNALEREFRDHNKVSCDVECWLLYEATAS